MIIDFFQNRLRDLRWREDTNTTHPQSVFGGSDFVCLINLLLPIIAKSTTMYVHPKE